MRTSATKPGRAAAWLLAGFTLAVGLRVAAGGPAVAASAPAGLLFAFCLVLLSWPLGRLMPPAKRLLPIIGWGTLGAVVLFAPAVLFHLADIGRHARPAGNYIAWSAVVGVVAASEELFLRGALYAAIRQWRGNGAAAAVAAIAFAGLHIPLYGWRALPLDLMVGLWLGILRYCSGSWLAPALSHILADLGAWWIV